MKVLQICNKPPIPPADGGCIAMRASANAILSAGNTLKILAIETVKHPLKKTNEEIEFIKATQLETVFIDTSIKPFDAFLNLLSDKSYNVERFWSEDFQKKLIETIKAEKFDIIQLESIFVAPYIETIRNFSGDSKIVLRAHNLEHEIWSRSAVNEKNPLKSAYLKLLSKRLKKYEKKVMDLVDVVAPISNNDAEKFIKLNKSPWVRTIPVNVDSTCTDIISKENSLFFIGAMDWHPNVEGLNWFIENAWPKVNKQLPDLKLHIAGRKMSDKMKSLKIPGVVFEGEIEDAHEFMVAKKIMIVPLFSGSGVRVKILEAMSLGTTVISTALGAEGIGYTKDKNILIANNVEQFIDEIYKSINNPEFCKETGLNAMNFIKDNFSTQAIAASYSALYKELIKQ